MRINNRLSVRIAIAVGLLALVGAAAVSFLSFVSTQATEMVAAQRTLIQLGQTVERTATIASYLDNREIAEDALAGLAKNEIVAAVSLKSKTGFSASYGNPQGQPQETAARFALKSPFTEGEVVGELAIYPRQDIIALNARAAALERAMLLGGYTLVIALLVMFIIQWQFVPAFKGLAMDLHAINPGSDQRLNYPAGHDNDEISFLVNDINSLLDLVKDKLDGERHLRQEIETLGRRSRLIFERASAGIFLLDEHGRLVLANNAFFEIVGAESSCTDEPDTECLHCHFIDVDQVSAMVRETMTSGALTAADLRLTNSAPGSQRWANCLFTRIRDDDNGMQASQTLVQGIMTDITQRKQEELSIRFEAERDPLTKLHNRRSAERVLASLLESARIEDSCVAVCLIDLDNFKPINDTHGHEAGDKVLVSVAERMIDTLRETDLAARMGGDEFMVAIPSSSCRQSIQGVSRKLLDAITRDIELDDGNTVRVGASIGIALSSEHGSDMQQLMALADRAMYQVKTRGKNDFQIYELPDA